MSEVSYGVRQLGQPSPHHVTLVIRHGPSKHTVDLTTQEAKGLAVELMEEVER